MNRMAEILHHYELVQKILGGMKKLLKAIALGIHRFHRLGRVLVPSIVTFCSLNSLICDPIPIPKHDTN